MKQQPGLSADGASRDPELLDSLAMVLDLVRSGSARTRPDLARLSGLGRNVVAQRVAELLGHGLLEESGLGAVQWWPGAA